MQMYSLYRTIRSNMPAIIDHDDAETASNLACAAISSRLRNPDACVFAECFTDEFHVFVKYPTHTRLVAIYHFT